MEDAIYQSAILVKRRETSSARAACSKALGNSVRYRPTDQYLSSETGETLRAELH